MRSVLVGMYRKQLGKPEIDAVLAEMSLSEAIRAEQMDVSKLVELSNRLLAAMESEAALTVKTEGG